MYKTMFTTLVFVSTVVGCASHPHPTDANYPNGYPDDESALGEPKDNHPCTKASGCDKFDTAGDYIGTGVASSSRWLYNEGNKAWDYVNSPEAKDDVKKMEDRFDAVGEALKDYATDVKKAVQK